MQVLNYVLWNQLEDIPVIKRLINKVALPAYHENFVLLQAQKQIFQDKIVGLQSANGDRFTLALQIRKEVKDFIDSDDIRQLTNNCPLERQGEWSILLQGIEDLQDQQHYQF